MDMKRISSGTQRRGNYQLNRLAFELGLRFLMACERLAVIDDHRSSITDLQGDQKNCGTTVRGVSWKLSEYPLSVSSNNPSSLLPLSLLTPALLTPFHPTYSNASLKAINQPSPLDQRAQSLRLLSRLRPRR